MEGQAAAFEMFLTPAEGRNMQLLIIETHLHLWLEITTFSMRELDCKSPWVLVHGFSIAVLSQTDCLQSNGKTQGPGDPFAARSIELCQQIVGRKMKNIDHTDLVPCM